VKFREHLPLALAVAALGLAIAQRIHPFGNRIPPGILIVVALLFILRYAMQRQLRKRNKLLNEVPRRPLGISDDPE
jgi:hypothetical protein